MPHLNASIDTELEIMLRSFVEAHNVTLSAAIRTLLRQALGVTTTSFDAGWREGYTAGFQMVQEAATAAIRAVTPAGPPAVEAAWRQRRQPEPPAPQLSGPDGEAAPQPAPKPAPKPRSAHAKLTPDKVREIRAKAAAGQSGASLSREYGMTTVAMWQLLNRRTWRDVD